jgi:hypothetical protein
LSAGNPADHLEAYSQQNGMALKNRYRANSRLPFDRLSFATPPAAKI